MNTQLEYQLLLTYHRQLLAQAELDRQVHEAPRRPSRLKLLWAAAHQRLSRLGDQKQPTARRPLQETSA